MAFSPVDIILLLIAAAGGGLAGYTLGCRRTRQVMALGPRVRPSGEAAEPVLPAHLPANPEDQLQGVPSDDEGRSRDTVSAPSAQGQQSIPDSAGPHPSSEAGRPLPGCDAPSSVALGGPTAGADPEPADEIAVPPPADTLILPVAAADEPVVPVEDGGRKPRRKPRPRTDRPADPPTMVVGAEAPTKSPDDLKRITGIGPKLELRLNALGITSLAQMAAWTQEDLRRVGEAIGAAGRPAREDWAGQARTLLGGVATEEPAPGPLFDHLKSSDKKAISEAPALLFPDLMDKPPSRPRRSR